MEEGINDFFSLFKGTAFSPKTEQDMPLNGGIDDRHRTLPTIVGNT
jgi:hypothetical protein